MSSVVLASKSAVRTRLLAASGVAFEAVDSGLDEAAAKSGLVGRTPDAVALVLAEAKALRASATSTSTFHSHKSRGRPAIGGTPASARNRYHSAQT